MPMHGAGSALPLQFSTPFKCKILTLSESARKVNISAKFQLNTPFSSGNIHSLISSWNKDYYDSHGKN